MRSTSSVNLECVCKTVPIKEWFQQGSRLLIRDLQHLEREGVSVQSLGYNVKGTVWDVSADTLAAHLLAGFQCGSVLQVLFGELCRSSAA